MTKTLAIINADIWTGDPSYPHASRLCVRDGRIAHIDDGNSPFHAERTIDACGGFVCPGLIDAHTHLLMAGETLRQLDLSSVSSREAFEEAISMQHDALPPDRWLIAFGWHNENWGGVEPDASWLRAAGDRPVVAWRMDSHVCLVNEAVMALCPEVSDPPGGTIVRHADGSPTGLFVEAAAWSIIQPLIPALSAEERQSALLEAARYANRTGLTTVGSMEYATTVEHVYQPVRDDLTLRVALTLLDRDLPLDTSYARQFASDDRLHLIGFKSFLDGTLGARTARMLTSYKDAPGTQGMFVEHAATGQLQSWFDQVVEAGFQPAMHAIGDAAARLALDVIEHTTAPASRLAEVRPRIEHAQQVDPADIARFDGVIASMQPLHRADDGRYVRSRLGEAGLSGFFRFQDLRGAGAILAFGSDWPIVSCDPIRSIRAAVTGETLNGEILLPEQTLTVGDALLAHTHDAAHALHVDHLVGTLTPGKRADIVLLDRNPFRIDWSTTTPCVRMTIVNGRVVHGLSVDGGVC